MHADCPDFDLCEGCEAHPIAMHPDRHPLLKIKSVETVIPKIQNNREVPVRSTSPPVATPRCSYDYSNGYNYNPSEVVPEIVPSTPIPQLNTPSDFRRSPIYYNSYALPSFHGFPAEDRLSIPMPPPLPPARYYSYPTRSASPTNSHVSPFVPPAPTFTRVTSPFTAQSSVRDLELLDPSPCSSRPVTPVWPPLEGGPYDITVNNPFMSAQESASSLFNAKKNSPSATSLGTWVPPSHELNHLIQAQTAAVKSFYEEARGNVNGANIFTPSEGNTPFQSPLGNEALLNRPASTNVPEPSDIAPVSSANRSLAALLDDYHSTTSLAPSSLATSVDEREVVSEPQAQKALTADFVADITVPDGQKFPPGAEFVKCWRMMNDGERDWPESTELVFVAGQQLLKASSPQSMRVGRVKIGSEVDLWTGELKVGSSRLMFPSNRANFFVSRHQMRLAGTLGIGACGTTRVSCLVILSG
jgi:next to BRCA1 gene 1 protein